MRRSEGDFVRSSPYRRARRSGPALVTAAAIEDAVDCGSSSVSGTGVWKRAPAGEKVPSLLNLAPLRGQVLGCGDEAVAATRQQTWWFRPSIRLDGACSGASEGPVKLGLSDLGATILNLDDDASDLGGSDVYWYSLFPFSGACWFVEETRPRWRQLTATTEVAAVVEDWRFILKGLVVLSLSRVGRFRPSGSRVRFLAGLVLVRPDLGFAGGCQSSAACFSWRHRRG
jgi:hypothetical protein|uniref:Uncharacterized protein n=1 Tax=Zea mays TaxID=4577 RepID=A0A804LSI9_MAIZE